MLEMVSKSTGPEADQSYLATTLLTHALEACLLTAGLDRTQTAVRRLAEKHGLGGARQALALQEEKTASAEGHGAFASLTGRLARVRWADADDDSDDCV